LLLLAGVDYLAKSLGCRSNVEFRKSDNNNWNHNWRLSFGMLDRKTKSNIIKRIISLDAPKYVFDIETESHTFVGGIGCVVLHNTQQVKIFSNVIEADQRRYNEKIFPQILQAFHITDWKLRLLPPEEKVESVVLQQAQQKVAIATQMMTLGFQVELKPGSETIENVDFIFTGKAQNPMMAAMGGEGGQLPSATGGGQGNEEQSVTPASPPQVPQQAGMAKSMRKYGRKNKRNKLPITPEDLDNKWFNREGRKEKEAYVDPEAQKIYEGTNLERETKI
jgi:hypothetical protein